MPPNSSQQNTQDISQPTSAEGEELVLVFGIGPDWFGFNVLDLDCVCRPLTTSPVLRSADFFDGMFRLKGILTPVINLGKLFYDRQHVYQANTRFITVKQGEARICFVAEHIIGFKTIESSTRQNPPDIIGNEYIQWVYPVENHLILMLDKDKLVDVKEVAQIVQSNRPSLFAADTDDVAQHNQTSAQEV